MKKLFEIIFCFTLTTNVIAQNSIDFNNYQPLKCSGTIPEDFRTLSQDKFKTDVANSKNTGTMKGNRQQHDFLLENNYITDQLLLSGKVLFGDTVTDYVNMVADHVLINQPELRSKLRFYCLKSSEANAFSTEQGIVFVTLGLLAQLENEAQLAFVLSHEIAHYEKHHSINKYMENEKIFSGDKNYKYNTYDDNIRSASSYSKELELQADSLGLVRLSSTGYDCGESIGALFVLQFSELPFEDFEFKTNFLENPVMKFPKDLFLDSVRQINLENDQDDDSYSTHPNIATRRKTLEKILANLSGCGTAKFSASKNNFYTIQKIARFETIRIELNRRDYCSALYNAYVLQKDDSSNSYLKICIAKALYGMAKYKNHDDFSSVVSSYGEKEGNQQQAFYFFSRLDKSQLNMIALRYLYNLSLVDSSYLIGAMRDDLASEAVQLNNLHYDDMKKTYQLFLEVQKEKKDTVVKVPEKPVDNIAKVPDNSNDKTYVSKYDKLRKEKKQLEQQEVVETKNSDASKFSLLAFSDILDDPKVKYLFQKSEDRVAIEQAAEKAENDKIAKMSDYQLRQYQQREANEVRKKGVSLGIDTVVFVDPFYLMADDRNGLKLIRSETQQLEFSDEIVENAKYADLNIGMLNPKSLGADEVEKYNDIAIVNDWIGERLDEDDDMQIIPIETDRMIPIVEKYHTTHFCYTGVYNYKKRRDNRGAIIFYSIICYPLLPFGIVYALTPEYHTYYYTLMYNVETGKSDIDETIHLKSKSKKGYINSIMYDTMIQIKRQKKTKTTAR